MEANGGNGNHPKKGDSIKVEPIKNLKDVRLIKKLLADRPRDLAIFVVGVNTNLRASDILGLRVGQVKGLAAGSSIEIKERKTGKKRRITLNGACISAIKGLLAQHGGEDRLFMGQRGPLTVSTVNNMVKAWCREINLKGNYGSHTLRKTWGYHQRVRFGVDLPRLMVCFNHSSQKQTLDYLCIQPEEIKDVYENEI
ncbi:MAG: tyrosine-type recombinase/integrase [Pseudomonadota bacterium]